MAIEVPAESVIDDGQLSFLGIADEQLAVARAAVEGQLARFARPAGMLRFPIAFFVFTARRPPA